MLSTRKFNLILAALSVLLLLSLTSLHNRARALERELAAHRLQCEQRIERLRRDFQAETEDLQQYLQTRYNFKASGAKTPAQSETDPQQTAGDDPDPGEPQAVERKYRFMSDLSDRESVKVMLLQLLQERERLAAAGEFGEQMGILEGQIGELLGVVGYQEYQMLKDSDPEQHHLGEYAASVSEFAPINHEQERSMLFTKLRHKQVFRRVLSESGFYQQQLSAEARDYVRNSIQRALENYKNNYLQEVRQLLNSEQFAKLQKYETAEFNWELDRLLKQIDAKAASTPP